MAETRQSDREVTLRKPIFGSHPDGDRQPLRASVNIAGTFARGLAKT